MYSILLVWKTSFALLLLFFKNVHFIYNLSSHLCSLQKLDSIRKILDMATSVLESIFHFCFLFALHISTSVETCLLNH